MTAPAIAFIKRDLSAPLGPTIQTNSPESTRIDTSRSAARRP
jgi:hypothetical protein